MQGQPGARRASSGDRDLLVSIISTAFSEDPLWSHALAGPDGTDGHKVRFWELFIDGALRFPSVWLTSGDEAAAIWIPPGCSELSEQQQERLADLATETLGTRAGDFVELLNRFEAAHPRGEPHYYLSLLGTHPHHRGKGLGMQLASNNLVSIDAQGMPAYLESSNPANNSRYEMLGFRALDEFAYPHGGPVVTTMWRDPR